MMVWRRRSELSSSSSIAFANKTGIERGDELLHHLCSCRRRCFVCVGGCDGVESLFDLVPVLRLDLFVACPFRAGMVVVGKDGSPENGVGGSKVLHYAGVLGDESSTHELHDAIDRGNEVGGVYTVI